MEETFQQHVNAEVATRALEETFTAYGAELERVEDFKYLRAKCRIRVPQKYKADEF